MNHKRKVVNQMQRHKLIAGINCAAISFSQNPEFFTRLIHCNTLHKLTTIGSLYRYLSKEASSFFIAINLLKVTPTSKRYISITKRLCKKYNLNHKRFKSKVYVRAHAKVHWLFSDITVNTLSTVNNDPKLSGYILYQKRTIQII